MTADTTKALVTGADGFVGQHLLGHLLESGYAVSASTLELPPSRTVLGPAQMAAVDWKAADVRDHDALYRLIAAIRPDQIYHLAGFSSGALARAQAGRAMQINAGGTVNLCEAVYPFRWISPLSTPGYSSWDRVTRTGTPPCWGNPSPSRWRCVR